MIYRGLIVGVGNIGAMYDIDSKQVSTYAKACSLDATIEFDIFDINPVLLQIVSAKYNCKIISQLNREVLEKYDFVVISSPTPTHYSYLRLLLGMNIKLIICEKPVDTDLKRLKELESLYRASTSKVIVNYYRRFQIGVAKLKRTIDQILLNEKCTNILIKYQRGFHNNASHAFDLLNYLFNRNLGFSNLQVGIKSFDEFKDDATVNFSGNWGKINIMFMGLRNVQFSHFETELYFEKSAIFLKNGCNEIEFYETPLKNGHFYPKLQLKRVQKNVLNNYMISVLNHAKKVIKQKTIKDNFIESVEISKNIINIINK